MKTKETRAKYMKIVKGFKVGNLKENSIISFQEMEQVALQG